MARGAGRKPAKAASRSIPVAATKPSTTSSLSTPPAPFKYAPTSLRPFLSTLPTNHVWLVHLDHTPKDLKRRVFLVPVLLNLAITLLLCVRIYYAVPVYLQQIITIFGYDTAYRVDTEATKGIDLVGTVTSRTFLLMVDYAIFGLLGSWPKEFIFGGKASRFVSPWDWRWTLGFKETEIVVRRGRKWDTPLLDNEEQTKTWSLDEELSIKFKVEPAMRRTYTSKTGYLLLDRDWDLDFHAMLDAHRLVDKGTIALEDLQELCFVYYQQQWLVWIVHEDAKIAEAEPEQDSILRKFRDTLTALGQEEVFYRWIEIVQYETSQPGGFTEGRQAESMRELRKLLTDRGVDFARFWDDIGGRSGLPGFESTAE